MFNIGDNVKIRFDADINPETMEHLADRVGTITDRAEWFTDRFHVLYDVDFPRSKNGKYSFHVCSLEKV